MKRTTMLIVDDMEINRGILVEIFKGDHDILEAEDGEEAVSILKQYTNQISVVLLDLIMPVKDGYAVLEEMKKNEWLSRIPVLLITSDLSEEVEKKGYLLGVTDIIRKPFDAYVTRQRVNNIIELYFHKNHLEDQVLEQTKILRKQFSVLKKQSELLKETNNRIIDTMSTVVEFRNLESGQHIRRIKEYTKVLAEYASRCYPEYHLTDERIKVISSASALHDVGKIAIPDNILLKPSRLTEDEFNIMKSHTTKGCEIIESIADIQDREYYDVSYNICRHHHEKYDGKGYPDGLKGETIPLEAQIVSIADVYDALSSERVYKSAYSKEKSYQMILDGECGIFSPKLMDCFKMAKKDLERLQ